MPSTYQQRFDQTLAMLKDPDLALTLKEALALTYHWVSYELILKRIERKEARLEKHAKWMRDTIDVCNLRIQLNNQ